ncbi:hypothetical protein K6W10_11295 [Burkholderia dolosa]|uniref:Uncharacterized protein n=1 Tax=Burkholderia dolosa TaxID=152500 RepID=A0A892IID8_9BURK|nr:hypothetical protein [Burkholderia dolosa]MBY4941649.1 hypothetical protein [Burkholderia dolosa]MCC5029084.1 hypothetical protein [Burkholderia dolosa]QRO80580.1 hypothetical protein I6K02_19905 [Burkholderia dolosa]UAK65546.1 hypothetical protein K8O94_24750 [Burkholderia dolosa]
MIQCETGAPLRRRCARLVVEHIEEPRRGAGIASCDRAPCGETISRRGTRTRGDRPEPDRCGSRTAHLRDARR